MNGEKLKNINCFLFDMDGTIYIEGKLIDGADKTIEKLRELGKQVVFLTNNSSVSSLYYQNKLNKLGIHADIEEIYTSGNATEEYIIENYREKRIFLVGTDELKKEFVRKGIDVINIGGEDNIDDSLVDVVVLGYDKELDYKKIVLLSRYVNMGLPYIATHPDINCPATPFYEPDIGSYIAMIEKSTGRVPDVVCGKPHNVIAEGLQKRVSQSKEHIAMVGDRLMTDIRFGNNVGFLSVLVLSGESSLQDETNSNDKADVILNSISDILKHI